MAIGCSKHDAKALGVAQDYIYSWGTYKSYLQHCCYFVKWCKEKYGCRTLDQCRPYADEWLESRLGLSAYTQKLEAAALAKLYSCSSSDFRKTASRKRSEITRSRGEKIRDAHFAEYRHQDFVDFCRSTGLRREELRQLKGSDLELREDGWCIHVQRGSKGGRPRYAPVVGNVNLVVRMMQDAGNSNVFDKIPGGADVHSYRADYATAIYKQYAKPINEIPYDKVDSKGRKYRSGVYTCRGDRKGEQLDRDAMLAASRALGHNRVSVVGEHYLRL